MAAHNFPAVMDEVFKHEGGLSLIRSDPGNWTGGRVGVGELRGTNYGIASHAHPTEDIRNLTPARAREIYRAKYWQRLRGDDLPPGIDLVAMDAGVNSGPKRGAKWLQQGLGFTGRDADGVTGNLTVAAARQADPVPVIQKACAVRMGFLRGLRTWGTFGRGWSRRVASVEAVGVRMALEGAGQKARPVLIDAKHEAIAKGKKEEAGAVGSVGGGATGGVTGALTDMPQWGIAALVVALVVVAILFMGRKRHETDRADAYQLAAEGAKR